MNKKLYPYQEEGARFLATHPHAMIGDMPGLGKTLQAIRACELVGARNILVVCPASVRLGWDQEVRECLGHNRGWNYISYNGAVLGTMAHRASHYDVIILDEAHFLKTPDSQRTIAIFGREGLARRATYKWCLTGTPVLNRPRELYPILKSLAPVFSDTTWASFTQRYCGAYFDGRGINTKGASHLDELKGRLEGFMLRRTKDEVFTRGELPPKVFSRVPLDVKDEELKAVYDEEALISNREAKISSIHEDFSALGDLARLLRLTGLAKVRATSTFIEEMLDSGTEKVVVFAKHREVISQLHHALELRGKRCVTYHGGMSDQQKKESVEMFARPSGSISVFIGQIQAAGTGINGLQGVCSSVVFAELSWVPGEVGQAVDRVHRIGQLASSVNIFMLHVPGTLESAVLGVHDGKVKVIDRLMGDDIFA